MVPPSDMRLERERKGDPESREKRNLLPHHACAANGGEGERRLSSSTGMPGSIFHQARMKEKVEREEVERTAGGRAKGRRVGEDDRGTEDYSQQRQKQAPGCVKKEENKQDRERKQPPGEEDSEGERKKPLRMKEEEAEEDEEKRNKNEDDTITKQQGGGENEKKKACPRGRREHFSSCSLPSSSTKGMNEDRHHGARLRDQAAVPLPPPAPSRCHTNSRKERASVKTIITSDEEDSEEEEDEEERERTSKLPVTADYTLISRGRQSFHTHIASYSPCIHAFICVCTLHILLKKYTCGYREN